ncbi:hypothetical protein GCM10023191_071920 [Actinoallomurus oryzae]|uniref:Uncharacterized protein n=2 Tax=Actinoallomurus oryzae TaxID=502180 RepID=A0ABP8QS28_9ACTN
MYRRGEGDGDDSSSYDFFVRADGRGALIRKELPFLNPGALFFCTSSFAPPDNSDDGTQVLFDDFDLSRIG